MTSYAPSRQKIGIAGLGVAGGAVLPAMMKHSGFELAAIAEPNKAALDAGVKSTGAKGFATLTAMLKDGGLDAVYIATPTTMHVEHIEESFKAGMHVLAEKPLAVHIEQAEAIIAAGEKANRTLVVGHSHSYDLPIQAMRDIVAAGELGPVKMINTTHFTDWLFRPRIPDELDLDKGGGVTYRQGSHQFDIIRFIAGGIVKTVRAATAFNWDSRRPAIGAHSAYLQLENGATATAIYSGYGYMSAIELCSDLTEWGFIETAEQRKPVSHSMEGRTPEAELESKRKRAASVTSVTTDAPYQPHFGLTIVSCERGDIRQSPRGLFVYSEKGREERVLPTDVSPHHRVLDEFHDAIVGKRKAIHDGRWALANLEVCIAVLDSSRSGKEIELKHQIAIPS